MPRTSFSWLSLRCRSHSWPSGSGTLTSKPEPSTSPNISKNEVWPLARSFWRFTAASMMFSGLFLSTKCIIWRRGYPVESKAPALMSDSITRRLAWLESTRSTKSCSVLNGPPASRSAIIACATPVPTPRMPARPKRTPSLVAVNSVPDSLTSGDSTGIPS